MCAIVFSSVKCFTCLFHLVSGRTTYKFKTRLLNLIIRLQHGNFLLLVLMSSGRYTVRGNTKTQSRNSCPFPSSYVFRTSQLHSLVSNGNGRAKCQLIPSHCYHKSQDVMITLKWHPLCTNCIEHVYYPPSAILRILLLCLLNI